MTHKPNVNVDIHGLVLLLFGPKQEELIKFFK
jgi:hypothetical protein